MIHIDEKDVTKTEKKSQSVKEIAEIMVENMKANMANPHFWSEKQERLQKARDKASKKIKERQNNEK